jgi:glycosyltransferase involved in cell wall biosynthesis
VRRTKVAPLSSSAQNPYFRLLYEHLAAQGIASHDCPKLTFSWLWAARHDVAFLHFHWQHGFVQHGRSPSWLNPLLSWVKLLRLRAHVAWAQLLRYRLLWTVHQLTPHERVSARRERHIAQLLARVCQLVLTHDGATADAVRAALPAARDKVIVVPHGSYIDVYPRGRSRSEVRMELGIPTAAFAFLCFGQLRAYKDIDLILKAFRATSLPDARLVVAGDPKDAGTAASLREAAAAESRITTLLFPIPDERVAELFEACDAAVIGRSDGGTSGSLILACSMGVPVVAADLPAYREVTLEGRAGWLFSPNDATSLCHAMEEAAGDASRAAGRGRTAYAAAERLSWRDIAERMAAELQNLQTLRSAD